MNTPDTKDARIQTLIERLRGSVSNMGTECENLGLSDTDDEVTGAVDAAIFECTCCGWWCEMEEEASDDAGLDEWTCQQCVAEL